MNKESLATRLAVAICAVAAISACTPASVLRVPPEPAVATAPDPAIADESFRKAMALSRDGRLAEAAQWYERAARNGHTRAQFVLATMYRTGRGVSEDPALAADWYRLAAAAGDPWAQFSLGNMYLTGEGVPKNPAEGARLQALAAEQGNREAQYNLGALYYRGEGVERNYERAEHWLEAAALQGEPQAQFALGRMYVAPHDGVPLDRVRAYAWFAIAGANGHPEGAREADRIARTMSAAERVSARALARKFSQQSGSAQEGL